MSNLTTTNTKGINLPAPIPPEMVPVNSALEVLQTALTAGIEAYARVYLRSRLICAKWRK